MELREFLGLIGTKRRTIYGIIAVFLVLAVVIVAVQRFKYSSKSQLLVVQENSTNIDAYSASKSSEYLSSVLASVVKSNSFYRKVMDSDFGVNEAYFGKTPKDQMKEWEKTVTARNIGDSGIISIVVHHPDRTESEKIVRAVNYVLMTQHTAYHGSGEAVKVRLIDQPVTSNYPVQPNIPLIGGLALLLGCIAGLLYVYLSPPAALAPPEGRAYVAAGAHHAGGHIRPVAAPARLAHQGPIRGQAPEAAMAAFRPEFAEAYIEDDRLIPENTPYGQHATVPAALDQSFQNDSYPARGSEEQFLRGDIRNVLQ